MLSIIFILIKMCNFEGKYVGLCKNGVKYVFQWVKNYIMINWLGGILLFF